MKDSFTILVAEDDGNDVELYQRAFVRANIRNPVRFVSEGRQVVDYLSGFGAYSDRDRYPIPGLLLLDIKMPRMTGLEVLEWVRKTEPFQQMLVIVVTSSAMSPDVLRARELGASGYYVKRPYFEGLPEVMKSTMFLAPENRLP